MIIKSRAQNVSIRVSSCPTYYCSRCQIDAAAAVATTAVVARMSHERIDSFRDMHESPFRPSQRQVGDDVILHHGSLTNSETSIFVLYTL